MTPAGKLTTHVLDTARGCPAEGLAVQLFGHEAGERERVTTARTNADGRTDEPLLGPGELRAGRMSSCSTSAPTSPAPGSRPTTSPSSARSRALRGRRSGRELSRPAARFALVLQHLPWELTAARGR